MLWVYSESYKHRPCRLIIVVLYFGIYLQMPDVFFISFSAFSQIWELSQTIGFNVISRQIIKRTLWNVGLSNKLDSELVGRKPVKRPHGQVVGTAIVDSKLLCEIVQRIRYGRNRSVSGPRDGCARLCRYGAGYTGGRRCQSSIMPRVGFLRRMSRMSFRSASVCWFGWLWGRLDWQARDAALPSQRCFQK